jgi:hypothetical protein
VLCGGYFTVLPFQASAAVLGVFIIAFSTKALHVR